jgi:AraC-like DNA-binding protein
MGKQHRLRIEPDKGNPMRIAHITDRRVLFAIMHLTVEESFEDIAEKVNLSVSRLRHLFKEQTGWSLGQFSKEQKLRRARTILQGSFRSVKETAAIAGFSDVSHFIRDYRARFGCTPGQTRMRAPASQECQEIAGLANHRALRQGG